MLVAPLLRTLMKRGTLRVVDARGKLHTFEGEPGPSVTIRLHDRSLHWKLLLNPRLVVGEAYMDGTLTVEDDATIRDFLHLVGANLHLLDENAVIKARNWLAQWVRPLQQHNPIGRAQRNVAHHYDLSDDLYELFLDPDRQYSCAYFDTPNHSLDQAQQAKKRHLASKLLLDRPGLSVLDIGSGWGGLGIYLHKEAGASVTGPHAVPRAAGLRDRARAEARHSGPRVGFHLRDYREDTGSYDRIVSVGMFEHVGVKHYVEFFRKVERLLKEDGVALLHTIARWDGPSVTNPWLRKYIFPGGYCPSLSEVFAALEQTGLKSLDVEMLRLHYADTLKHWSRNFQANRERVKAVYDERFCRMWEFYLAGSEAAFRHQDHMVAQIQLARRQDAAPLTRDYMVDWERAHAA